jgi:hypothetical protein
MRKSKSVTQINRFLEAHKDIYSFLNLTRNLIRSDYYHEFREGAFVSWNRAVGI